MRDVDAFNDRLSEHAHAATELLEQGDRDSVTVAQVRIGLAQIEALKLISSVLLDVRNELTTVRQELEHGRGRGW